MDIAALSIRLNHGKFQQQVSLSVMKMAMGVATEQSNSIAAMANDTSIHPHLGSTIDIQA